MTKYIRHTKKIQISVPYWKNQKHYQDVYYTLNPHKRGGVSMQEKFEDEISKNKSNPNVLSDKRTPDISYNDTKCKESIKDILLSLTERESEVIRMRFGIGKNTEHTLEEIGKQFDVNRERIRQIEARALRKLRHPSRAHNIKSFIDRL